MTNGLGIDASTWARLNPLLEQALDLRPAERAAWLEALPLPCADLKETLRDLLSRSGGVETGALLATMPKLSDTDATVHGGLHATGDAVGPYRLVRELGVGGMGAVWLADRTDGLMQRSVALKLPYGPFRGDLAARIAREREIVATLDHPHIARLHDAGIAADGQPYLALEYVDGLRIDRYCQAQRLEVPAILRLFMQAARAVSYAHSQLVVHRDIKPSNLLVDTHGQVKLLDFGIAKLLAENLRDQPALTQQGMRVLTPDYASPEQIAGLPVGTRSDVYSLGVLLFELLTGVRPYGSRRRSRAALEEAILADQAPRPSDRVADTARQRALRGDLDTIIGKALKKPADERYASVDALIDDIDRHLSSRPVLARPDSAGYRMRKYVVRHRLAVAAAAALLLTVCLGSGAVLWQAGIAIAERRHAEEVKDFIAAIFSDASPFEGIGTKDLKAVDLLKQADRKLIAAPLRPGSARIELTNTLAASLLALGDVDAAEPIVARAVTEAQQTLVSMHHQTVRALFLRSQVHRMRGRPREASADADLVLPTLRQRVGNAEGAADLSEALSHRIGAALDLGAYVEGEGFALENFALTQSRMDARDPARVNSAIALAQALRFTRKFDQALVIAERAYGEAIIVYGQTAPSRRMSEARNVYGRALADTGDIARGIELLDSAVADTRLLLGAGSQTVGIFLQNLVAYRVDIGQLDLAEANATEALEILGATMSHDAPAYAIAEHSRAAVLLARRDGPAALAAATHAAGILDRAMGPQHDNAIAARTTLALALMQGGRLDEASREIETVAARATALAPNSTQAARVALARGTIARGRGDHAAAMLHLRALVESTEPSPKWQRDRMRAWAQIGWSQLEQGAASDAVLSFGRALDAFGLLETGATPARADAQLGLDRAQRALSSAAAATPHARVGPKN